MLNLGLIHDDTKVGVLCKTRDHVRILIESVRKQRPEIDTGLFETPTNRVYFLNYRNSSRLQHGTKDGIVAMGLSYVYIEDLMTEPLPEFEGNQTGILSLLGL